MTDSLKFFSDSSKTKQYHYDMYINIDIQFLNDLNEKFRVYFIDLMLSYHIMFKSIQEM